MVCAHSHKSAEVFLKTTWIRNTLKVYNGSYLHETGDEDTLPFLKALHQTSCHPFVVILK
jgi:hypothetical protein